MKTQSGRSMIEMLGVLAIIGVLSVGGLAGYTRAMRANRANNILDFEGRCYVSVRSQGDGITGTGAVTCATELGETIANGLSAATCTRVDGGATTCSFTVSTNDLAEVVATKVGEPYTEGQNTFSHNPGAAAAADKWTTS